MRKIVLALALACSGCHACMAALLAEDEPTESTDPAAKNAPPPPVGATATATQVTATVATTAAPPPTAKPAATAPQNLGGSSAGVAGRYECFQMRVTFVGGYFNTTFVPGALQGFSIDGAGGYTSSGKPGNVNASATDVAFIGGPYDGWRGATGTNSTGFYVRFNNTAPSDPRVGQQAKSGDYLCYRQKS